MKNKYCKIYMNSEEYEFRTGIGKYCYGRITKIENNGINRDGETFKRFHVVPLKNKPKILNYIIEKKHAKINGKPFLQERKIVKLKEDEEV